MPDIYYVSALAADQTVNTIPEATLLAFGHHGKFGALLSEDTADAEAMIAGARRAGVEVDTLAEQLQIEGRDSFGESFTKLLQRIDTKKATLRDARDRVTEPLGRLAVSSDAAVADLIRRNDVTQASTAARNDCSAEGEPSAVSGDRGGSQQGPP